MKANESRHPGVVGGEGALGGTDASGRQKSMWAQKQEGHRLAGGRMQLKRKKVVLKQIQLYVNCELTTVN